MKSKWWVSLLIPAAAAVLVTSAPPAQAGIAQLTRYPYLTDVVPAGSTDNATVNFATDQTVTAAYATIGPVGSCTGTNRTGSKTAIVVNGKGEYQWKVRFTGLAAASNYCYRLRAGSPTAPGPDLLGTDPSPVFMAPGGSTSFQFAVMGDWGDTNADGSNAAQASLDQQIASSGAQFMFGTGDTAYNSGSQSNYGDLFQTGYRISDVFRQSFFGQVGDHIPIYNALGNHGMSSTFLNVWPEPSAPSLSGGRYQMDAFPSINGSTAASYPSAWYAFSVGSARFYVLTAAWANSNVGTGNIYSDDYTAHWTTNAAEYQWLAADLAAHPGGLKFVFMHLPMYSDSSTEHADTYLHSGSTAMTDATGGVAALLSQYGVDIVFNGHAHIYERNSRYQSESFVSYVTGGGGSVLEPVGTGGCGTYDAYAIGWSPTALKGYKCGAAIAPSSASQVYHFLLVSVKGLTVSVTPTASTGQTFDVQTYSF
ncbi:MAG TPA: metallophosphoesterase [Candidatus Saccharimonadia bacterium]|jgi:hypothetical protein